MNIGLCKANDRLNMSRTIPLSYASPMNRGDTADLVANLMFGICLNHHLQLVCGDRLFESSSPLRFKVSGQKSDMEKLQTRMKSEGKPIRIDSSEDTASASIDLEPFLKDEKHAWDLVDTMRT